MLKRYVFKRDFQIWERWPPPPHQEPVGQVCLFKLDQDGRDSILCVIVAPPAFFFLFFIRIDILDILFRHVYMEKRNKKKKTYIKTNAKKPQTKQNKKDKKFQQDLP